MSSPELEQPASALSFPFYISAPKPLFRNGKQDNCEGVERSWNLLTNVSNIIEIRVIKNAVYYNV